MWEQLPSGRVVHRFEWVVMAAALALIPVLVIESEVKSSGWRDVAAAVNWVVWVVFLCEFLFVLSVAPRKGAALRAHWLDLGLVVLTVPAYGSLFSGLRLARLIRLVRLLRLGMVAGRALQAERALTSEAVFRTVGLLTLFVVVLAGAVESLVDGRHIKSVWDGIWWAVVTVTTVGYGDLTPHSVGGRIVAMVVMLFGIGFLSVLTATIASRFVKTDTGTTEMREALARIEAELAELRQQLPTR
jgi:voltage-gated potassium channel